MFYIIIIFEMCWFLPRCSWSFNSSIITLIAINCSFGCSKWFSKGLSGRIIFFANGRKYSGSWLVICISWEYQYWVDQSGTTITASVLSLFTFAMLTIFSQTKNTLYMFGRILNTPLPAGMITSDIKTSSQHTLVGLNLVTGTILIFCSVHFTLIQVNLTQEEVPKSLITQLPNRRITQNIKDGNETC